MATFLEKLDNVPNTDVIHRNKNLTTLQPSSGKYESGKKYCEADANVLNALMREVNAAYDGLKEAVDIKRQMITDAGDTVLQFKKKKSSDSSTLNFILSRIDAGLEMARELLEEIKRVIDPMDVNYLIMKLVPLKALDFAIMSTDFWKYYAFLLKVQNKAASIKIKYRPKLGIVMVTGRGNQLKKIDNPDASGKIFKKYVYDIQLQAVLPDTSEIKLHTYISQFMYDADFDETSMPIYSAIFKLPESICLALKNHFEYTKFYLTIRMFEKFGDTKAYKWSVPTIIIDNLPLMGIDPKFPNMVHSKMKNDPSHLLPKYDVKIDFVSFREQMLNGKVKARVFNNCTLADVIGGLCTDLSEIYKKKAMDTKREVKFAISPPDNNNTYEQIIVDPGSFTQVINSLQTKYGIYKTGVRVMFDCQQSIVKTGGKEESNLVVTIKDKGGIVPIPDQSFDNVIVEVVSPKSQQFYMGPESGQHVKKATKTMTIRTDLPYLLDKVNSEALAGGQATRVQYSSTDDNITSVCDDDSMDTDKWSFYWSKYENQFALTQLQDEIREKNLQLTCKVMDCNVIALNDNINYIVKFYTPDDEANSGEYRLSRSRFSFQMNNTTSGKEFFEIQGILHFKNLRGIRTNGNEAARSTYGTKLATALAMKAKDYEPEYATDGINTSKDNPSTSFEFGANDLTAPLSYWMRKDLYGVPFPPKEVPMYWNMGGTLLLKDVIGTVDGGDSNAKYNMLMSNLDYFLNTQKMCSQILGPIIQMCGRFPMHKGKIKSFYRYEAPNSDTGSSAHLVGLGADIGPAIQAGDFLCDPFVTIANSGIPYDQIILESDGSKWQFIHIDMAINGTPRRKKLVNLSLNGKNKYYEPYWERVSGGSDLWYKNDNIFKTLNLKNKGDNKN